MRRGERGAAQGGSQRAGNATNGKLLPRAEHREALIGSAAQHQINVAVPSGLVSVRTRTKAMYRPSGDQAGLVLSAGWVVKRTAFSVPISLT